MEPAYEDIEDEFSFRQDECQSDNEMRSGGAPYIGGG
jgi:hypothetical protein